MASISNSTSNSIIVGTSYDDSIENRGDSVTIDVAIGDDSIHSSGSNVPVLTKDENNTLNLAETIKLSAGNNTLTGNSQAQIYQYTGGNHVITNYSHEDTIELKSGEIDSYSFDGGDLIFKIGKGTLTLQNMTNHAITIKDSSGKTTTKIYSNGYSQQDAIKNFVKSMSNSLVNNKVRLDEAVRASSHFNSMQEVIDRMLADCRKANNAQTFIRDYCGIITGNKDNGSATGWDIGGNKVKDTYDLYTSSAEAKYPESTTFTIRGLTVTVPEKSTLSEKEQLMVKAFYSWWAEDSIKLIEESYGIHFNGQKINLEFMNDSTAYGSAYGGTNVIRINMAYNNGITESNMRTYMSRTLAHEMTHVMQGNFGIMSYAKSYMTEGMADLTRGGDNYALADNPDKLAYILDLDNEISWIDNPTDYNYMYSVGYMFWRYFMKQAADNYDSTKKYTWSDNANITGTNNAEFLTASGKGATITAGSGNDTITAYGENIQVFGESGNDYILTKGNNSTVIGGASNDDICNYGDNVLFLYRTGDGSDIINGFNSTSTLGISRDTYSTMTSGSNIIVKVGNEKITLSGAKSLSAVNIEHIKDKNPLDIQGTNGNDTIENTLDGATIQALAGDDEIYNEGSNVTIDGGNGNDLIRNGDYDWEGGSEVSINGGVGDDSIINVYGYDVKIDGGAGNDLISNYYSSNVSINGGDGNDSIVGEEIYSNVIDGGDGSDYIEIVSDGGENSINGGAGNDTIISEGNGNTISGGTGNDIISLSGDHYDDDWNLILYTAGDGNDTIWGIGEYDTLSISSGTYSTMARGNDIIFKVGNGSITLKDAREIDEEPVWTLKGTTATCKIDDETKITVKGVTSINGLTLSGDTIIVSAASLGTQKVTVSDGYTLVLDDDVKEAEVKDAEWTLKNTTATLSQKQSAGYVCNGSSITYSNKTATVTLATLTGIQSLDGLSVDDNVITLSEDALGSSTVKLTKGDYKLELDDSVVTEPTSEPTWIISGTKATYKDGNSAYYSLASNGKSVNFVKAAADNNAKDLITLNGVNKNFSANDVEIDETNQVVTLYDHALNKKNVTIGGSEDYSLALGDDVKEAKVDDAKWSLKNTTATLSQKQSVGYVCNGGSITYSSKSATVTLATLTGVQSVDGLSVDGDVITLSEDALGSATVKLTKGDYKLELDDSVITEPTSEPTWIISGNKATYKNGNSAYYSLASNGKSVNFVKAAADKKAKDLITLSGVNKNFSADDIELDEDNKVVTLYDHALNKKTITIAGTENYSLALGDDVKEAKVENAEWTLKNTTATLSQKQSVGYVCNGGSITYSSKSATATLATLTGIQSVDGLSVDGNVIMLSEDALGSSTVKLTKGDYKLELDDDVATEPTTEPTWFISGNKATYKDGNSAYYSLASNGKSVNFVKATADNNAENLITLNGVNKNFSADDVEIDEDNQIVILSNTALDKKNVTIGGSEDYSLALGDDVIEPELGKPKLEVKGSKATLTQSTSIGYVLTNDKTITYSKKVSATTLATVTGVKSKSGISFDESSITLANSALTNKVTVSGDVSFEFKANYKNASITGSKDDDVISVLGTGVSVTGGKGDDYFTSGGGNTFIYASGDGDDVIADFTSNDRLKVTSGDFTVDTNGNDVIVSVTKGNVTGSITLSDAAGQFIAIIDSNNKGHHYFTSASDYWFDENSFDTDIQLNSLANFSETNNQIGSTANINDMNNSLESFNTFSNEEKYFANYCDKK